MTRSAVAFLLCVALVPTAARADTGSNRSTTRSQVEPPAVEEPAAPPSAAGPDPDLPAPAPAVEPGIVVVPPAPAEPEPEPEPEPAAEEEPAVEPDTTEPPPEAVVLEPLPAPATKPIGDRPYPGTGQVVGGAILIGEGALIMILGSILLVAGRATEGSDEDLDRSLRVAGGVTLGLGVAVAGGGTGLLVSGLRWRKRYAKWADENTLNPPSPGNGMIVGGSVLLFSSTLRFASSASVDAGALSYVLASAELAAGATLMGFGVHRRRKFNLWRSERGIAFRPTLSPTRFGGTVGAVGRF